MAPEPASNIHDTRIVSTRNAQAKRLKELERELTLDKQILKEALSGKC